MSIEELEDLIKEKEEEIKKIEKDTQDLEEAHKNNSVTPQEYEEYISKNSNFISQAKEELEKANKTIDAYNTIVENIGALKELKANVNGLSEKELKEEYDKRIESVRDNSVYLNDKLREAINVIISKIEEPEEEKQESVEEVPIVDEEKKEETKNNKKDEKQEPEVEYKDENEAYIAKLQGIDRVFTDESRIDEEHKYLSTQNAYNLGYLNTEDLEKDSLNKVTPVSKFASIKEKLWKKIENFRNRNKNIRQLDEQEEELKVDFSEVKREEPIKEENVIGASDIEKYAKESEIEKTAEQIVNQMANNPEEVVQKEKSNGLGRSAFVSLSIMAITTAVVSLSIVALGLMILN